MPRFVVHYDAGMCGTDNTVVTDDGYSTEEEVYWDYTAEAWDWFWQFNDPGDFEDVEPELDIWVEEFNEEKHGYLL